MDSLSGFLGCFLENLLSCILTFGMKKAGAAGADQREILLSDTHL